MSEFSFDAIPATRAPKGGTPELVGTVVALLNAAPRELTLKEVEAVLQANGVETPALTTIRAYVNRAVQSGEVVKVTRETYIGAANANAPQAEEAAAEDAPQASAEEDDVLAGL